MNLAVIGTSMLIILLSVTWFTTVEPVRKVWSNLVCEDAVAKLDYVMTIGAISVVIVLKVIGTAENQIGL